MPDDPTELDILGAFLHYAIPTLSAAFHHASVVPVAKSDGAYTTDNIGENIEYVKVSTIWKEPLDNFRANTQP